MSKSNHGDTPSERDRLEEERLREIGHPRGTLAIVLIYAALFALGWIGLYVGAFLMRGAPH